MILQSSLTYTEPLISTPPINLQLPEPINITESSVTFSADEYKIILHIYNGYLLWSKNYEPNSNTINLIDTRLEICTDRLKLRDDTIDLLSKDREHIYELFNQEREDKSKAAIQGTLKTILISSCVGIVGVAIGLIVGIAKTR
jgi:hypothetical protein